MISSKNVGKLKISMGIFILLSGILVLTYLFIPNYFSSFDNRLRDMFFLVRGEIPTSNNVVIVDIDDKSLSEVGQWPWSRDVLSTIVTNLTNAKAAVIGFDIVFAEEDRTNPFKIMKELEYLKNKNVDYTNIPNYDLDFAKTINQSPVILGYLFQMNENGFLGKKAPEIPVNIIENNRDFDLEDRVLNAKGTLLNIPIIQDNAYSSGFFNNVPDVSGIIRSVPLVMRYEGFLYPSLSLELIRIAYGEDTISVNYDEVGIESINVGEITIPTDMFGRLLLNFRGKEKSFQYISASDILNNKFKPKDIENKIILLGTSASGLFDLRATPFESIFPGVEVHANVIDNIMVQDFISKPSYAFVLNIIHMIVLTFSSLFIFIFTPLFLSVVLLITIFALDMYLVYFYLFNEGIVLNTVFPLLSILCAFIASNLINYFLETKQNKIIKDKFASKVSKNVMDSLLKNPQNNDFCGEEKEVTVFFSDIRGFTNISESMSNAKALISYLNDYMEPMSNIITNEKGTIDKFIGDAIMAYWNAPIDVKNHADNAVRASLKQIQYLDVLNKEFKKEDKPFIDIGIGLNTGLAVVGEMGSIGRSDYTVIGDAINLGARLESLCKYYNSKLNISNFTKDKLEEKYIFRYLDLVRVKGKSEPVEIWQVIDFGQAQGKLLDELELYHHAIVLYKNKEFIEAKEIFETLENNEEKTNQNIYSIYLKRCDIFIQNPPEVFDGVFEHQTKG